MARRRARRQRSRLITKAPQRRWDQLTVSQILMVLSMGLLFLILLFGWMEQREDWLHGSRVEYKTMSFATEEEAEAALATAHADLQLNTERKGQ